MENHRPDLLRDRRLELGLPPTPPPLRPARGLVLLGSGIGLVLVLVVASFQWLAQVRERTLEGHVDRMAMVEQRARRLNSKLTSVTARSKGLDKDTRQIVSQLVAVRSGSAFLEQLRRVTPQGVQLRSVSVDVSGTTLMLEGVAQSPEAFERVNAFGLNLEDLPAIPAGGAVVQRATADETGLLQFTVKVSLDVGVAPTAEQLTDLGADGLARRYQLLKQRGMPL
jgi:type IV pilus assembly protein PilN